MSTAKPQGTTNLIQIKILIFKFYRFSYIFLDVSIKDRGIVGALVRLLEEASDSALTPDECRFIIKHLTVFAAETPMQLAVNLFHSDQVTTENIFQTAVSDPDHLRTRNWQWIFSRFYTVPSDSQSSIISPEELAWTKSRAIVMGRLMAGQAVTKAQQNIRLIVGYWLVKLYVRNRKSIFAKLPSYLLGAYTEFLEWMGAEWSRKKFPDLLSEPVSLGLGTKAEGKLVFEKFCKDVDKKRLHYYLMQSVNCTLAEFMNEYADNDAFEEEEESA